MVHPGGGEWKEWAKEDGTKTEGDLWTGGEKQGGEWLEEAFKQAIQERREELIEAIRSGGIYNLVYTVDGILTIGYGAQTKHSVLAGGADIWAGGTVQLKTESLDDAFGAYKQSYEKLRGAQSNLDNKKPDTKIAV